MAEDREEKDDVNDRFEDDLESLKKKGYSWTKEETLLLISLYEEKQKLFKNINYKKKQIWEIIASRMKEKGCTARPSQCEGKWKALTLAFRKCEDHNNQTGNNRKECPFYRELSEVYGYRPNVRPYATASSSGLGDSIRPAILVHVSPNKNPDWPELKGSEDNIEECEMAGQLLKRPLGPENSCRTPVKKAKRSSTSRQNEGIISWLKEYTEERERENERRLEKVEQQHQEKMKLFSGLLDVLKELKM